MLIEDENQRGMAFEKQDAQESDLWAEDGMAYRAS
jgi:hypothetical protein